VVSQVVAFAVGGDGGCGGRPRAGIGGVFGTWAERPSEREGPVVVGQVGADLLPPVADQLSGCTGELELFFTESFGEAALGTGDVSKADSLSAGWIINAVVAECAIRRPLSRHRRSARPTLAPSP
jgi:hypothetical protein